MLKQGANISGRYKLVLPLGERSDVCVWSAEDLEEERSVALAIIEPNSGDVRRHRFLEVIDSLSGLEHPNIVKILASEESDEHGIYSVMEMLEGDTLAVRLEEEPALWFSELMDIGGEVLEGLSVLHEKDVVHGDIEPGNIYLDTAEGRLMPKLIGLGYSRAIERANDTLADPDDEGYLRSLVYASPEQARGQKIDPRSDLYSLGVILYEALSGKLTVFGEASVEIRAAIIKAAPPSLHEVNEEIPKKLSQVIDRALQLEPEDRFESARDMQRELLSVVLKLPSTIQQKPLPTGRRGEYRPSQVVASREPESSEHEPATEKKEIDESPPPDIDVDIEEPEAVDVDEPYFGKRKPGGNEVEAILGEIANGTPSGTEEGHDKGDDSDDEPLSSWLSGGRPDSEDRVVVEGDDEKSETSLDLIVKDVLPGVSVLPTPIEKPKNLRWTVAGFGGFTAFACLLVVYILSGSTRERNQVIASGPANAPTNVATAQMASASHEEPAKTKVVPAVVDSADASLEDRSGKAGGDAGSTVGVDAGTKTSSESRSFARVYLVGLPRAVTIRLDGAIVDGTELDVPLDDRAHTLVIWAPGYKRLTKRVSPTADTEMNIIMTPSGRHGGRPREVRSTKRGQSKALMRDPGF